LRTRRTASAAGRTAACALCGRLSPSGSRAAAPTWTPHGGRTRRSARRVSGTGTRLAPRNALHVRPRVPARRKRARANSRTPRQGAPRRLPRNMKALCTAGCLKFCTSPVAASWPVTVKSCVTSEHLSCFQMFGRLHGYIQCRANKRTSNLVLCGYGVYGAGDEHAPAHPVAQDTFSTVGYSATR